MANEFNGTRVLRLPQVKMKTGLGRSTIYERMEAGTFPKSFKIGVRSIGWSEKEIDDWITDMMTRPQASHASPAA